MIKNISIISKHLISIELANKEDLENFTKIFTVLDRYKAARTLFVDEVNIEYEQYDTKEVVKLIRATDFTYIDIENILHHLSKHGISVDNSVIARTFAAAYSNAFESKDMAFSLFNGLPQFNVRVSKNTFVITPMSEEHLELSSKNSKTFIESLRRESNTYSCVIQDNTIDIIIQSEIHQAIDSIVKSLVQSSLLAKDEEKKLTEKLRQLAFKDQAFVEYFSIKTINKYPHDHPLKKYEGVTRDIESILDGFIKSENSKSTVEQLKKLKIAPDAPRIITKTIEKLVKFH
ncbi:MAG: hypothetical protein QWI36_00525 [Wolbachia endosymbiont of Tyrophagus putrescentiae]|nr:hypothetical protein [Wolbachia endosymbiont of Tyrophagus putrescentiae]